MKTEKRKLGDLGEAIAKRFLRNNGFEILDQNYLKKWGEIDIVAQNKDSLRFIEVKTIQSSTSRENEMKQVGDLGEYRPEENVHPKKLERMYRTVETYLEEKGISREKEWQIDVIAVRLDPVSKKAKIEFIENVI